MRAIHMLPTGNGFMVPLFLLFHYSLPFAGFCCQYLLRNTHEVWGG
jgi:hypothetical protein